MAKMWKVEAVDCDASFAVNARKAMAVRIAEVYAHSPALSDPHDSAGMHDLRISVKRLRYSLEFFAPCYESALVAPILDALSDLQEHLGELHDADVLIPEFQRLLSGMSTSAQAFVTRRMAKPRQRRRPITFERFRSELARGSAVSDRAGVLGAINRMRRQRHENYRAALTMWRRLEGEGFRDMLDLLVAKPVEVAAPPPQQTQPQTKP